MVWEPIPDEHTHTHTDTQAYRQTEFYNIRFQSIKSNKLLTNGGSNKGRLPLLKGDLKNNNMIDLTREKEVNIESFRF